MCGWLLCRISPLHVQRVPLSLALSMCACPLINPSILSMLHYYPLSLQKQDSLIPRPGPATAQTCRQTQAARLAALLATAGGASGLSRGARARVPCRRAVSAAGGASSRAPPTRREWRGRGGCPRHAARRARASGSPPRHCSTMRAARLSAAAGRCNRTGRPRALAAARMQSRSRCSPPRVARAAPSPPGRPRPAPPPQTHLRTRPTRCSPRIAAPQEQAAELQHRPETLRPPPPSALAHHRWRRRRQGRRQ
mmetsp:Transcript_39785/g.128866  ORF Transcript_39785/g.128866 Transcript_39785/m.128866 type:complete len:252 (+) Transcript_39785:261-1016(+)